MIYVCESKNDLLPQIYNLLNHIISSKDKIIRQYWESSENVNLKLQFGLDTEQVRILNGRWLSDCSLDHSKMNLLA